jgi:CHAT domain-containing protein/Tfp pilus assembly protein PilF
MTGSRLLFFRFLFVFFSLLLASRASAQVDPVTAFLTTMDSLARTGDEAALRGVLAERALLVGAGVGQLLDVALEDGDAGDADAESEKLDFADRLARLHEDLGGSSGPLDLVHLYRAFTPEQRGARTAAKKIETRAAEARGRGDYDAAADLLQQALKSYEGLGDLRSEAVAWGSLGVVQWYRGDFDAVRAAYQKALQARRAIEDRILEGRTLNGLGSVSYATARYEDALTYYEQAAALRERTGDLAGLGTSLTYLGNTHLALGQVVDAKEQYQKALAILGRLHQPVKMLELLTSIGDLYVSMGRWGKARENFEQALGLCRQTESHELETQIHVKLAILLRQTGGIEEAREQLDLASTLLEQFPNPQLRIQVHRERGLLHLILGENDLARDDILASVKIAEETGDAAWRMDTLINLGQLYLELRAFPQALATADRAQALAEEHEDLRTQRNIAVLRGDVHQFAGEFALAADQYARALEQDERDGFTSLLAADELGLAMARAGTEQYEAAREGYRRVMELATTSGQRDLTTSAILGLGDSFEKSDPDSAFIYYERGLDVMEAAWARAGGAALRTSFLSTDRGRVYEEITRFFARQHRIDPTAGWSERAFQTVERARARGLLDLLDHSFASAESASLEAALDSLYRLDDASAHDRAEQHRLEERIARLRRESVRSSWADLADSAAVASLEAVRQALPPDGVLLEFAVGDSASFLWAIDSTGTDLVELPDRRQLAESVRRLRDALARPGAADEALRASARALYRTLLEPVEAHLHAGHALILVTDDVLLELPFEVLLREDPAPGAAWRDLAFVARDFAPVYAPSSSIVLELARAPTAHATGYGADRDTAAGGDPRPADALELLALGDPDYTTLEPRPGESSVALPPLPHTREEVLAITGSSPDGEGSTPRRLALLGPEATEARLKIELRRGSPRLLHLATHGLLDPIEPSRSCVVLGRSKDDAEDGYLHSLEILTLPLDCDLVVLSACESARGRIERGEGVVGLTRSFLAAGARSVVASLWSVSDVSTARLMASFYAGMLDEAQPPARALQRARLVLLDSDEFGHPFFWAPFVLMGASSTR